MINDSKDPPLTSRRSVLGLLGAVPVAASGVAVATGAAEAGGPPPAHVPADLRPGGLFDRTFADLAKKDEFSGTVLLAHRGRPVLTRCYGMANAALGIPIRPDTIFSIASVGKLFTAVAIAQLAERRTVAFHEKLGSYLDGFTPAMSEVTIHQLLTHTAGFGDYQTYSDWREVSSTWQTPEESFEGTMAFIRRQEQPLFVPGSAGSYSNSGMYTLGAVVAKVSGGTFWDYVRTHIFAADRAGMPRSDYYTYQRWQSDPNLAHSYGARQADGQRPDLTTQLEGIGLGGGAGGGFSTAPDLLRFAMALSRGKLLTPAFAELIVSPKNARIPDPAAEPGDSHGFTAYGFTASIVNKQRKFGHGGGAGGAAEISTNISVYPDLQWVAIILANYKVDMRSLLTLQDQLIT